jgi:hypothetical protein
MADPSEIMEIGFNVVYLTYIFFIVAIMIKRKSSLSPEKQPVALRVLLGFSALLIGDIGHVGARLYIFLSGDQNTAISGIGTLFEAVGLIFLFMFWMDVWRLEFSHSKTILYYILIITGILGLIIFTFPQNDWTGDSIPQYWGIIRNVPWTIQGIGVALLISGDARKNHDKLMGRIGICIFISYLFYLPVVLIGYKYPLLGMLMIPGTITYMFWEFLSIKRFFPSSKSEN